MPDTRRKFAAQSSVWLIVAVFGGMLAYYYVPAFPNDGTDPDALLWTAESFARGELAVRQESDPLVLVGDQFLEVADSVYAPKYGIGYPLVGAAFYRLLGPAGPFLVNPLIAILGLIGLFLLGREIAGATAGAVATLVLACNPIYATFALSPVNHAMAAACGIWSMYFLWRWIERERPVSAFLCGALVAWAATVRFSEALLCIPVAVAFSWVMVVDRGSFTGRRLRLSIVLVILGALLAGMPAALYQWKVFGSPLTTGYSLTSEASAFSWVWLREHAGLLIAGLLESGFLPVAVVGVIGLLFLRPRFAALFLGAWMLPILAVNAAYYSRTGTLGDLRLFLTAFAPLAIAAPAALVSSAVPRRWQPAAVATLIALVVPWGLRMTVRCVAAQSSHHQAGVDFLEQVSTSVPPASAIWARGYLLYFVKYAGNFEVFNAAWFEDEAVGAAKSTLDDAAAPSWLQRRRLRQIVGIGDPSNRSTRIKSAVAAQLTSGKRVFFVDYVDSRRPAVFLQSLKSVLVRQWSLHESYCDGTEGDRAFALFEILGTYPPAPSLDGKGSFPLPVQGRGPGG